MSGTWLRWRFATLSRLAVGSCNIAAGTCEVQNGAGQLPPCPALRHQESYISWSHQPSCPQLPMGTHDTSTGSVSGSGSGSGSASGSISDSVGAAVGNEVGVSVDDEPPEQPLAFQVDSPLQYALVEPQ